MNFFQELFVRLLTKNPKFFDYIQVVALVVGTVAKLPATLATLGVNVPILLSEPWATILAACSAITIFLAQLPNAPTPVTTAQRFYGASPAKAAASTVGE